jgi:tRNA G18 (ribose-2'-O)-methylase SpoU
MTTASEKLPVIIIADNIRSLYNVGSIFRVADGVNLEGLYLCGITAYPQMENDERPIWMAEKADRHIRKTGLTGVTTVPFRYFKTTAEAIKQAKKEGRQVIGLELTETSVDYRDFSYKFPLAVVIGHETEGVDVEILPQLDGTVHLPMRGAGLSLNVATATSAFLYALEHRFNRP